MEEPSFRPRLRPLRTWRGAAWVNTAWLLVAGAARARRTTTRPTGIAGSRCADAVERSGFREYYHPRTGAGHGEHRFGWSTLLLDLPPVFCRQPQG